MREILFRGKRIDNGEWVYGNYIKSPTCQDLHMIEDTIPLIMDDGCRRFQGCPPVDPATVGQYTLLEDKDSKRIFEGDIVRDNDGKIYVVLWSAAGFGLKYDPLHAHGFYYELSPLCNFWNAHGSIIKVIGNIHDNPELLEEGG